VPYSSRRSCGNIALVSSVLILVSCLDFVLPGNYVIASLYAFPMFIATFFLSPRGVAATSLIVVLFVFAAAVIRHPPMIVGIVGILGAAGIGALSVQLARQRSQEIHREAEREAARRRVSEILESIGDGFFALDSMGRFTYANQHAERFFGHQRDELIGRSASDRLTNVSLAAFQPAMIESRVRQSPSHIEVFDTARNRWYEVHIFPSESGLSVYFHDATQRKEAEDRWREAEAHYRSLIEQVPAVTYRVDRPTMDGQPSPMTFISPQVEALLGYPIDEWMNHPGHWFDWLHPDDRERVVKTTAAAAESGTAMRIEYRLVARDGRIVWLRDEVVPISDVENGSRTWQGILFDITTEKLADQERAAVAWKFAFLSEMSNQMTAAQVDYEATLKQMADLIVPDLADWCIVYVFEAETVRRVAVAHARPEDEALASRLSDLPITIFVRDQVRQTLDAGNVLHFNTISDSADLFAALGEAYPDISAGMQIGSAVLAPLPARGKMLGSVLCARRSDSVAYTDDDAIFIDEVAHRFAMMVDNARLYQEARRAVASREEFLSVAAHELRTPLTSIKGYTQLLERRLNRTPGAIKEALQTLSSLQPQILRFERIVDDLLDLTRIERGQFSIRREPCDLVTIARETFDTLRYSEEHNPDQPMHLIVPDSVTGSWDPVRIAQVIGNLLSNSLRYSLGQGAIVMRVEQQGDEAVIEVQDQGIGLTPDELRRVFEPFFRSDVLAGQIAGSGLGLPIAKRIVEQHQGTIDVESEAGVGSTFTVRLPLGVEPIAQR
jgi:PAS domain S-box-containing protein